jgi:hypothetical protein
LSLFLILIVHFHFGMSAIKSSHSCSILSSSSSTSNNIYNSNNININTKNNSGYHKSYYTDHYFTILNDFDEIDEIIKKNNSFNERLVKQETFNSNNRQSNLNEFNISISKRSLSTSRLNNKNFING